jgi:putative nucleotidyltransferase with HDIG domain
MLRVPSYGFRVTGRSGAEIPREAGLRVGAERTCPPAYSVSRSISIVGTGRKRRMGMEKLRKYINSNFEGILVVVVLISALIIHYLIVQKLAFLNFYYLPVLLAGFFLGRRSAVLLSLLCVLLVTLFFLAMPGFLKNSEIGSMEIVISLLLWACFLILVSYVIGTLFTEKENRIQDLRNAYLGVLEILSKYMDSADRYTKGHCVRVAGLAAEIAIAMELPRNEVENIKAAALLHDIGKVDVSMDLIRKAASLNDEEKKLVAAHVEKGADILLSMGNVLKEAVPIVLLHHKTYQDLYKSGENAIAEDAKLGSSIVSVADTYDAIITDRPYRAGKQPFQALSEIEDCVGTQFHPDVVKAFARVLPSIVEKP